jgi:hypothetical protein
LVDACELDEPRVAVATLVPPPRELDRETSLAGAAGSMDRDQAGTFQQALEIEELVGASDE